MVAYIALSKYRVSSSLKRCQHSHFLLLWLVGQCLTQRGIWGRENNHWVKFVLVILVLTPGSGLVYTDNLQGHSYIGWLNWGISNPCYEVDIFVLLGFELALPCFPWPFLYQILLSSFDFPPFRYPDGLAFSPPLWTWSLCLFPMGWQPNHNEGQRQGLLGKRQLVPLHQAMGTTEGKWYFPTKYVQILVDT